MRSVTQGRFSATSAPPAHLVGSIGDAMYIWRTAIAVVALGLDPNQRYVRSLIEDGARWAEYGWTGSNGPRSTIARAIVHVQSQQTYQRAQQRKKNSK